MKLKKNDEVVVTAGKNKGKRGKIEAIMPALAKVTVGGLNLYKRHVKKQQDGKGGIMELSRPLPVASVMLICPKCNKPTRVGYEAKGDDKHRVCKKCHQMI